MLVSLGVDTSSTPETQIIFPNKRVDPLGRFCSRKTHPAFSRLLMSQRKTLLSVFMQATTQPIVYTHTHTYIYIYTAG